MSVQAHIMRSRANKRKDDVMTPDRKCWVNGRLIEEYYWGGKMVVYVDHHAFEGSYGAAQNCAATREPVGDRAKCPPYCHKMEG